MTREETGGGTTIRTRRQNSPGFRPVTLPSLGNSLSFILQPKHSNGPTNPFPCHSTALFREPLIPNTRKQPTIHSIAKMKLSTISALLSAATLALAAPTEVHKRDAQADLGGLTKLTEGLTGALGDNVSNGDAGVAPRADDPIKDTVKAATALLPGGLGNLVPRADDFVKDTVKAVTALLPGGLGNIVERDEDVVGDTVKTVLGGLGNSTKGGDAPIAPLN